MKRWILVLALLVGCDKDADGDGSPASEDCDDADARVYPGASEVCDGLDNDCNGTVDDDAEDGMKLYPDGDGDGFGLDSGVILSCSSPLEGFTGKGGDCDDTDAAMNLSDQDGDGHTTCDGDCDDADDSSFPGGTEVCDEKDNDCDGTADNDAADQATWYTDADEDGYGAADTAESGCNPPEGSADNGDDCNDEVKEIVQCDSIYDIQQGTTPVDTDVVVDHMIVTGFSKYGVFIQAPAGGEYSGVWCYGGTDSTEGLTIGDMVALKGTVIEYNDLTEIDFSVDGGWLLNFGAGTPIEAATVTTAALTDPTTAEPWEGVLIKLEDVSVLDEEIGFGEWMLNDEVRIDDMLYHINDDIPDLAVGDSFESITGPLTYAYDNYKLEPRSFDDFVGYTAVAD